MKTRTHKISETKAMANPQITKLAQHGKSGWSWTVISDLGESREFRTDGDGEGLWEYGRYGHRNEFSQVLGSSQFDLPNDRARVQQILQHILATTDTFLF